MKTIIFEWFKNQQARLVRNFVFVLAFMFTVCSVSAQNEGIDFGKLNSNSNRLEGKLMGDSYYTSALANRYFFLTDWLPGDIYLEDDDVVENVEIRFLISENELIFYNARLRNLFKIDKDIVTKFVVYDNGNKRVFTKIYFDGVVEGFRYFEMLFEGEKSLLENHSISEIKVSPYKDKNGVLRDTQYQQRTSYYLYSADSDFQKVNIKRRAFIKLYPQDKKQIRKIYRQNRLGFNTQNDLVQAVSLLNEAGIIK